MTIYNNQDNQVTDNLLQHTQIQQYNDCKLKISIPGWGY